MKKSEGELTEYELNFHFRTIYLTFGEGAVVGLEGVGGGRDCGVCRGGGSGGGCRGPVVLHGLLEVQHGVLR